MEKPKYLQIKDQIKVSIEDQKPNSPIPSEREIALLYDASRMTVRRAIEELVEDGYLYRDKNKGTFVADEKMRKKIQPVILEEEQEENTTYKILYFDMYYDVKSEKDVFDNLEIEPGELFLRVVRLVMKKEAPICIEEIYIARKNLSDDDIGNLKEFLNFDKYISEGSMSQVFVPMMIPTKYAALLKIKLNTPIIRVDNLISRKNGQPFIFIKSYYNPEKKKIEITL
ncbi:MAG: GntR family transcriptional regulator [Erysipelotrichia bacterium]|nr:GntR family transcriptional regulator [Erysipelotrichia bacterium]